MASLKNASLVMKLSEMPLRYRLSVAFFFLAFLGTSILVALSILSQNALTHQQERERLYGYHRAVDHYIELQGQWAVSLASNFAHNPEIAQALAEKNRLRLIELCYPAYLFMKHNYGISQFNFHILPPRNFLRLQRLYEYGDDLSYRQTILDAVAQLKAVFGLESGITGYGIRGVAPVFWGENLVGTVEIGFSFGSVFLEQMKKLFAIEASLLVPDEDGVGFSSIATTFPHPFERTDPAYAEVFQTRSRQIVVREIAGVPYAVLVRTISDYKGNTVALAEFCVDRTETLALIARYRYLMLGIELVGMLLSVAGIYIISAYFTRPIAKMVNFAREITLGRPVRPLGIHPSGELKVLAHALEEMLFSLEESRAKIQDYAENLEQMVHLRTRALRESEEKYRTLVESVPFVVYRLLGNGKTIFINHFVEELIGIPVRQVLEDVHFWKDKVIDEDRPYIWPMMDRCLAEGREFKAEYRILRADGKSIFVLDHALAVLDEKGRVETVDGFLLNITDRYRLQEQILQTEELRTLSEVSARLAHEIRNPLVAAGGFARRLLQSLPAGDANREKVQIIVQEVARLEKILEKTLSYLKPFEIVPERSSLHDLMIQLFSDQKKTFEEHGVGLELDMATNLPLILLDQVLFRKALENISQALLDICPPGSSLRARTYAGENTAHLEIILQGAQASDDDIEHFFYPFTSRQSRSKTLDLSLAKMIIHKHQGFIDLRRKESNELVLSIRLPL